MREHVDIFTQFVAYRQYSQSWFVNIAYIKM